MRSIWSRSLLFGVTVAGALFLANCESDRKTPPSQDRAEPQPTTNPKTGEQAPGGPGQGDAGGMDGGTMSGAELTTQGGDAGISGGDFGAPLDGGTAGDAGTMLQDRGRGGRQGGGAPTQ